MSGVVRSVPVLKRPRLPADISQDPLPTGGNPMSIIPMHRPVLSPSRPASLTQAGPAPSGSCPECGSERVTALAMTLTDGTPVEFASCHDCEHRHWAHEGEVLAFADVITRSTKRAAG